MSKIQLCEPGSIQQVRDKLIDPVSVPVYQVQQNSCFLRYTSTFLQLSCRQQDIGQRVSHFMCNGSGNAPCGRELFLVLQCLQLRIFFLELTLIAFKVHFVLFRLFNCSFFFFIFHA